MLVQAKPPLPLATLPITLKQEIIVQLTGLPIKQAGELLTLAQAIIELCRTNARNNDNKTNDNNRILATTETTDSAAPIRQLEKNKHNVWKIINNTLPRNTRASHATKTATPSQ